MKKKLVAYLLVSALAVTALIGCGKKGGDADAAGAAATTEAGTAAEGEAEAGAETEGEAVENAVEEAVVEEVTSDATAAAAVEAVEAATVAEAAAEAGTGDAAAEEFVDDEAAEAVTGEAAAANTEEDLIVEPGTVYTVRFGGNIYATMDENDANIVFTTIPGNQLTINERLENYWYNVTYYLTGDPTPYTGYIKIQ